MLYLRPKNGHVNEQSLEDHSKEGKAVENVMIVERLAWLVMHQMFCSREYR